MKKGRRDGYVPTDTEAFRYLERAWKWHRKYGGGQVGGNTLTPEELCKFFKNACHHGDWSAELERRMFSEQGRFAAYQRKRRKRLAEKRERAQALERSQLKLF